MVVMMIVHAPIAANALRSSQHHCLVLRRSYGKVLHALSPPQNLQCTKWTAASPVVNIKVRESSSPPGEPYSFPLSKACRDCNHHCNASCGRKDGYDGIESGIVLVVSRLSVVVG